jgi:hypothetical protein
VQSNQYRLVGIASTATGSALGVGVAADVAEDVPLAHASHWLRAELDQRVNELYPWLDKARVHEVYEDDGSPPGGVELAVYGDGTPGVTEAQLRRALDSVVAPEAIGRIDLDVYDDPDYDAEVSFTVRYHLADDANERIDPIIKRIESLAEVTDVDAEIGY